MTTIIPQCFGCKFFTGNPRPGVLACKAFRIIPDEILFNEFDHREPYDKNGVTDHGITFEPKEQEGSP